MAINNLRLSKAALAYLMVGAINLSTLSGCAPLNTNPLNNTYVATLSDGSHDIVTRSPEYCRDKHLLYHYYSITSPKTYGGDACKAAFTEVASITSITDIKYYITEEEAEILDTGTADEKTKCTEKIVTRILGPEESIDPLAGLKRLIL